MNPCASIVNLWDIVGQCGRMSFGSIIWIMIGGDSMLTGAAWLMCALCILALPVLWVSQGPEHRWFGSAPAEAIGWKATVGFSVSLMMMALMLAERAIEAA